MATKQTVTIYYKADASGALAVTRQVVQTVTTLGPASAGARSQLNALQQSLRSYAQNVRNLLSVYLSFHGVQVFSRFIDEYTNLNGRLKVVMGSTQAYATAQAHVNAIAQETYSSLSATANLYARLTVALETFNSTQEEVALIARTVNQALLVSGATSAESSSAIIQLSQAFASGVLRGEEFNAVNEAAPRIMTALAKSLDVSRGSLRQMASEGKLTADILRKALVDDAQNIAKEAENVPLTIGRGYELLRNNLLRFVGAADSVYGVSTKVATSLVWIGENLQTIASVASQAVQAIAIFAGARGLLSVISAATAAAKAGTLLTTAFGAIGGWPVLIAAAVVALVVFRGEIFSINKVVDEASDALERFQLLVKIDPAAAGKLAVDVYQSLQVEISKVTKQIEDQQKLIDSRGFVGVKQEEFDKLDNLKLQLEKLKEELGKADASFDSFNKHAERVPRAAGTGTAALQKFTNEQLRLKEALIAGGGEMGKQIDAAEKLKVALLNVAQREQAGLLSVQEVTNARKEALAVYQKEIAQAEKATRVSSSSTSKLNSEASARERLNAIIEQYSNEEDDANKVRAKFTALQNEVSAALRAHPQLLAEATQAVQRLKEAEEAALLPGTQFAAQIYRLNEDLGRGNIDQYAESFARLSMAIEEATAAGDTAHVNSLTIALETLEAQSGKSASASEYLREMTQRATDAAKEQARGYVEYWSNALQSVADAMVDFTMTGMKDWSSFGKSLLNIVKQIVADIIKSWLTLRVVNPILNNMFGKLPNGLDRPTGGGSLLGGITTGGGVLGNLMGGTFGAVGGMLAGFGGALGSFGAGLTVAGNAGLMAAGQFGIAQLAAGNFAVGLGAIVPVIGAIAAAASAINSLTGGRLFGTSYKPESATSSFNLGADGGSASSTVREVRQRALFGGRSWRTRNVAADAEAVAAAESLFNAIRDVMVSSANQLRGEAPPMLEAALRTVTEYDSKGKAKATKYFVDILGRTWEEATAELATTRLSAENLIATIDAILGTTVDTIGAEAGTAIVDVLDEMGNVIGTRVIGINDTITKALGDAQGEASAIAERWRTDANALMEGAQFLLLAATDIRNGVGLLGTDGTLTQVTNFVETLASSNETLAQTYARLYQSTASVDELFTRMSVTFAGTRTELILFSDELVRLGGGVDSFRALLNAGLSGLFSPEEQAQFVADQATSVLTSMLTSIGLDIGSGITSVREAVRSRLREAMAAGDQEMILTLLRVGAAINAYEEALSGLNSNVEETTTVTAGASTAIGVLNDSLVDTASSTNAALTAYRSFVDGLITPAESQLSPFNQAMQEISNWLSQSIEEARKLAIAAGLQGIAEQDLAAIHEEAARRGAAAIRELESATADLISQLAYTAAPRNPLIFEAATTSTTNPERFGLAAQVAQNIRQLSEVLGESVTDIMARMSVPIVQFLADLGVDTQALDLPSNFDALVSAARALGVELDDLSQQVRFNAGALSDASSPINDAFERALTQLPTAVGNALRDRLRTLEGSLSPEAQASARQSILDFINQQPPAIRAALAPFFDEIDVSSIQEQQLGAADQTNRYLSAANGFLERIATNTAQPASRVPAKLPGEKAAADTTNALLLELLREIRGAAKSLRGNAVKAATGANGG